MNKYVKKMKGAIDTYIAERDKANQQIDKAKQIYAPAFAKPEIDRFEAKKAEVRNAAGAAIDAAYTEAITALDKWDDLRGEDVTDDVKLLDTVKITSEEFDTLVERYKDNATMSRILYQWGEEKNKNSSVNVPDGDPVYYMTGQVHTAANKRKAWDHIHESALSIIQIDRGDNHYMEGWLLEAGKDFGEPNEMTYQFYEMIGE